MKFPIYTTEVDKISLLERWILVHSILYYERDTGLTTDHSYDNNVKQLLLLMKDKHSFRESRFYETFKGFKGSSGYDLEFLCKQRQPDEHKLLLRIVEDLLNEEEKNR